MTDPTKTREDGIVPYFIDWGASPHPAESSPRGCTLLGIRARHPDYLRVRRILRALGLGLEVENGARATLVATIRTPKGEVELG